MKQSFFCFQELWVTGELYRGLWKQVDTSSLLALPNAFSRRFLRAQEGEKEVKCIYEQLCSLE